MEIRQDQLTLRPNPLPIPPTYPTHLTPPESDQPITALDHQWLSDVNRRLEFEENTIENASKIK